MELILGFVLGVAASFLVWYFVAHYMVPSIYFDPEIYAHHVSDVSDSTMRSEYRVRFRNTGRRDLIDLEFIVKLRVKGLRKEAPIPLASNLFTCRRHQDSNDSTTEKKQEKIDSIANLRNR